MRRRVADRARAGPGSFSGAFRRPSGTMSGRNLGSGPLVGAGAALAARGCTPATRGRRCPHAGMTEHESDFDREAVDDTLDAFTGV